MPFQQGMLAGETTPLTPPPKALGNEAAAAFWRMHKHGGQTTFQTGRFKEGAGEVQKTAFPWDACGMRSIERAKVRLRVFALESCQLDP